MVAVLVGSSWRATFPCCLRLYAQHLSPSSFQFPSKKNHLKRPFLFRTRRLNRPTFAGGGNNGGVEKGADEKEKGVGLRGFKWRDLLELDKENIAAVGLTSLLAWASVQALVQIFYSSLAILLAALKYSFIAAVLLFIVITLL